jgi:hypothetical protein
MSKQKHWQELTSSQKTVVILLGFLQFVLLIAALGDIRRRPAEQINGSKRLWTLATFVNFVGPLAYFIFGRK